MNQTTALVIWQPSTVTTTGIVTVCCGLHILPPESCCDTLDCRACCAECPTCPVVQAMDPNQRRENARADRELERLIVDAIRAHENTAEIAHICKTTAAAVEAALLHMPNATAETDLRNMPCSGCSGASLVHNFSSRCNWTGLAVNHG